MSNHLPTPSDPRAGELARVESVGGLDRQLYADAGGGDSMKILIRRVMAAMWRYKWLALLIILVGAVSGVVASRKLIETRYVVNSTLWVETSTIRDGPIRTSQLIEDAGWIQLLQSFTVLHPVVEKLRLYVEPHLLEDSVAFRSIEVSADVQPSAYRFAVDESGTRYTLAAGRDVVEEGRVGDTVGETVGFRWDPPADVLTPGREIAFTLRTPQDVTRGLRSQLSTGVRDRGPGRLPVEQLCHPWVPEPPRPGGLLQGPLRPRPSDRHRHGGRWRRRRRHVQRGERRCHRLHPPGAVPARASPDLPGGFLSQRCIAHRQRADGGRVVDPGLHRWCPAGGAVRV
jgi:hypothetical protein